MSNHSRGAFIAALSATAAAIVAGPEFAIAAPAVLAVEVAREPIAVDPSQPCPDVYAYGARYVDGGCFDGYLWDLDSYDDGSYYVGGEIPCPHCNNAAYQKQLGPDQDGERGFFTPPYGFGTVVFGDYFAPLTRDAFDAFYRARNDEDEA